MRRQYSYDVYVVVQPKGIEGPIGDEKFIKVPVKASSTARAIEAVINHLVMKQTDYIVHRDKVVVKQNGIKVYDFRI